MLILLLLTFANPSWAIPAPPATYVSRQNDWKEIQLKVELKNLVGQNGVGRLEEKDLTKSLSEANDIWNQCSVRFISSGFSNVNAIELQVPYEPQSQDDLSQIASALNPKGFSRGIPLTVAGPWRFLDRYSGLYLNGLGWVFTNAQGVERIGAMISALKLKDVSGSPIIAHELAHALSLPHVGDQSNLMGGAAINELTLSQCQQARDFAKTSLKPFLSSI